MFGWSKRTSTSGDFGAQTLGQAHHAALACDGDDRAAFLAEACGGDEPLRRELESLLAQPVPVGLKPLNWTGETQRGGDGSVGILRPMDLQDNGQPRRRARAREKKSSGRANWLENQPTPGEMVRRATVPQGDFA